MSGFKYLTDTGEESKMCTGEFVQKWTQWNHAIYQRVRATSMTQRRVENNRVNFWTFLPVSVKNSK